jgi:hypothetical protein
MICSEGREVNMSLKRNLKMKVINQLIYAVIVLVLLVATAAMAGSRAFAMGGAPASGDKGEVRTEPVTEVAGTLEQGVALGRRNGEIMALRLRSRTVDVEGCVAMKKLEDAMLAVTRSIRPPAGDEALARGFFRGYLDALKTSVREVRDECGSGRIMEGTFAGALIGNIVCRAAIVDVNIAIGIELDSFFDGVGSDDELLSQCSLSAKTVLQDCGNGQFSELTDTLMLVASSGCSMPANLNLGKE